MAVRRIEPILAEIMAALDGISAATTGKTLDDFRDDWLLRHGVERGIEIISEATRHIPDDLLALAPELATFCVTNTTRLPTPSSGPW
jgi:uncharacterized protein with HEPN domain